MTADPEKRNVWRFLMSNMFKKELVDELKGRFVIHWNYRSYESLPHEVLLYGLQVEEMYLKGNKLRTLPDWISKLSNLRNIYLDDNELRELPQTVGYCRSIEVIDLQDNELTELPENFGRLVNLMVLNLRSNCLRKLPKGFENLKALAVLNLTGNGLETLPTCICELKSLQELILDNNRLKRLPQQITQAPNLNYLSVNKNDLEHLPLMIFVNGTSMTLRNNPHLNYFHYELGCDLSRNSFVSVDYDDDESWHLDLTGCAIHTPPEEDNICIKVEGESCTLKLPKELEKIHDVRPNVSHQVTRLFELALRASYEIIAQYYKRKNKNFDEIIDCVWNISPIGRHLLNGPVSRCTECCDALFTEAVLWTMRLAVSNGENPMRLITALLLFCSTQCSSRYAVQHPNEVAMRVNWSIK